MSRRRRLGISDAALIAFVRWCRLNAPEFVLDPVIARRVLEAYATDPAGPREEVATP